MLWVVHIGRSFRVEQQPTRPFEASPPRPTNIDLPGVEREGRLDERALAKALNARLMASEETFTDCTHFPRDRATFGLVTLKPGSDAAMALKTALIARGLWSQYLEVGIGPDAEIFTKAQPMSAVGHGMMAGLHPRSTWNNPEPEVVLVISSVGKIVGATLGNDVNLRDFEGRSALLLSKAKDNNASASLGPFIRFFDHAFTLDTVRRIEVRLDVTGPDGFTMHGTSSMREIARDPADLVAELFGTTHQYPDGAVLYLGTMFAPTDDRGEKGMGFTHHVGDVVTISAPELGALTNVMAHAGDCPPWTFGAGALMRNLMERRAV